MKVCSLVLIAFTVGALGACGDKGGGAASGSASAAAKKKDGKKKTPSPANKKADLGKAKKGGDNKDAKPSADSKKAGAATIGAKEKKKADDTQKGGETDPCAELPDGTAECHDNLVLFCSAKEMYVADCNQIATDNGADSGSCFESEKGTDCLLCGAVEGAGVVCCDASNTICCTEAGECFEPAAVAAEE